MKIHLGDLIADDTDPDDRYRVISKIVPPCKHLKTVNIGGGQFCQSCGLRAVRGSQGPLRGHSGAFCGPESELIQQIKETLELSMAVFRIGQWRADKAGTDEGVPDLMLCYQGRVLMMEVKVKGGKVSSIQQWLADEDYSVIVWNLEEAVDDCNRNLGTEIKL